MNIAKKIVYVAMFAALIAVGAFIKIPIPYVPCTLQTFFVVLAALFLGAKLGALSVLCYIFIGLCGVPIFTQGGGITYVLMPTFGYLIGFVFSAFIIGYIVNKKQNPSFKRMFLAVAIGQFVVYLVGVPYFYLIKTFYLNSTIAASTLFIYCFLVTLPGDIVWCIIAVLIVKKVRPLVLKVAVDLRNKKKSNIGKLKRQVLNGKGITKGQAKLLINCDIEKLTEAADCIRKSFCGNKYELCKIINAKCGGCGEDCKFCAQSKYYNTEIERHGIIPKEEIIADAEKCFQSEIKRYSIVTSGRTLTDNEVDYFADVIRQISGKIDVCASFGLLNEEQFKKLKEAGLKRVHCNIETSKRNFKNICTTHSFKDKLNAIAAAKRAGLEVCSGGIIGLGENTYDRIDMAFTLKKLKVKSTPINILTTIENTPFEKNSKLSYEDILRTIAIFRFIMPDGEIRLAGGRNQLGDKGEAAFKSGANAAISGDMLTTNGIGSKEDVEIIKRVGGII